MKRLRLSLLLGCCAVLSASSIAVAQSSADSSANGPTRLDPFAAIPASAEPSLFESAISQKNVELEQRIQRLEAELESRNQHPVEDVSHALERRLQQQDVGTGGLFGEVEVTFLRPHLSGSPAAFGIGPTSHRIVSSTYSTNVRYGLGYMSDSGIGFRARYWSYGDEFRYTDPFAPNKLSIDIDVVDTEILLHQRLRHWDLGASGGVRYSKLRYTNPVTTLYGPGKLTFEGIGPTFAANGRRQLGSSGFSVFGNLRGSILVGDIRNNAVLTFMPATTIEEELMTVLENQLGLAWTRQLNSSFQLEVRGAWETQYWMNNTLSDDVYGIGSNLGLTGPTLAVELKY